MSIPLTPSLSNLGDGLKCFDRFIDVVLVWVQRTDVEDLGRRTGPVGERCARQTWG